MSADTSRKNFERYLFVTCNGQKRSKFFRDVSALIHQAGGTGQAVHDAAPRGLHLVPTAYRRDLRLVTSFSDLRYYLECPHDFYLRKVLGFAPTIDQAFGYGRGVHNLMRAVHSDPQRWAALAKNPPALKAELQKLIDRGLFYLRYTVGDPADNMRSKGMRIIADYIARY